MTLLDTAMLSLRSDHLLQANQVKRKRALLGSNHAEG